MRQVAQATEKKLRENQRELEMREQKKKAKDAKKIRVIVHESDKSKGTSHAEEEMEKLMLHDEQELLSLSGKDDNGMTTMAGGLTRSCAPRQDLKKWSTSVKCLREMEKAPIKTGWAETDKGQPGKPNVRARWTAKEYKTHARPVLYAPTPPLEALKEVLSEIATGTRGGKVVALVDVRRAYFHAPARRRVFVELPPQDCQPSDEHVCGLLQYRLYGTRDAAQNWEEELASTLSDLKLTRGSSCSCVWKGCIKSEHSMATVHGDDITIGEERSVVKFLIKMSSRKYEIQK